MADFYSDVRSVLRDYGYVPKRQGKGSHEIWHHPISGKSFTVPAKIKSRHTANEILKQAGIDKKI